MAKYHEIDCDMWEELIDYTPLQKLLFIYLFSNPSCRPSGVYKINPKTISFYTGASADDLKSLCGRLIEYDFDTCEVWVKGKLKRYLVCIKSNINVSRSVDSDIRSVSSIFIRDAFVNKYKNTENGTVSPFEAPFKGATTSALELAFEKKGMQGEEKQKYSEAFERFWDVYPARNGKKLLKKQAFKEFKKLREEEMPDLMKAVANYARSDRYPKDTPRFFKDDFWREWVSGETAGKKQIPSKPRLNKCFVCNEMVAPEDNRQHMDAHRNAEVK